MSTPTVTADELAKALQQWRSTESGQKCQDEWTKAGQEESKDDQDEKK